MTTAALIFDLDGTLVDTAPDLLVAINAVLTTEGRNPVDLTALRRMVGFGAASTIRQAFAATRAPVVEADLPRLVANFRDHYRRNIAVRSKPFPRVPETLKALQTKGLRMGVLTNKQQELTDLLLRALDLDRYFAAIFGAGTRPCMKPDPRLFHDVTTALGGGPAIMVGDSVTDVATARAAGAPVILVSYGYTPEPATSLGADAITDDFAEIPSLAEKLSL